MEGQNLTVDKANELLRNRPIGRGGVSNGEEVWRPFLKRFHDQNEEVLIKVARGPHQYNAKNDDITVLVHSVLDGTFEGYSLRVTNPSTGASLKPQPPCPNPHPGVTEFRLTNVKVAAEFVVLEFIEDEPETES